MPQPLGHAARLRVTLAPARTGSRRATDPTPGPRIRSGSVAFVPGSPRPAGVVDRLSPGARAAVAGVGLLAGLGLVYLGAQSCETSLSDPGPGPVTVPRSTPLPTPPPTSTSAPPTTASPAPS